MIKCHEKLSLWPFLNSLLGQIFYVDNYAMFIRDIEFNTQNETYQFTYTI